MPQSLRYGHVRIVKLYIFPHNCNCTLFLRAFILFTISIHSDSSASLHLRSSFLIYQRIQAFIVEALRVPHNKLSGIHVLDYRIPVHICRKRPISFPSYPFRYRFFAPAHNYIPAGYLCSSALCRCAWYVLS